jgi:hypothetical protein
MVTGSIEQVMQRVDDLPDFFDKKKVFEIIYHVSVRYSECADDLGAAVLIMYNIFGEMASKAQEAAKPDGNDE